MHTFKYLAIGLLMMFLISSPVMALGFVLSDETKGATISKAEDVNLTIRLRLQPRFDIGDLTESRDGRSYESESDLYLRRARLELSGYMIKSIKYAVFLSAD